MILAAAQTNPYNKSTEQNIEQHLQMINEASLHEAELILFPEMSLTGYQREKANEMAFISDDKRLGIFREKAQALQMVIIVGAPIRIQSELYIGSFIFQTNGSVLIYTKQFLHDGEEQFFLPGINATPIIKAGGEKIAIAICADICNPVHAENASKNKAGLYLASIFYTPNGMAEGYEKLGRYADKYKMDVLMANYCGQSYGLAAAGQSAFWNKCGKLKAKLNGLEEGLLIIYSNQNTDLMVFNKGLK